MISHLYTFRELIGCVVVIGVLAFLIGYLIGDSK